MTLPIQILEQLEIERRDLEVEIAAKQARLHELELLLNKVNKKQFDWQAEALNCIERNNEPLTSDQILRNVFWDDGGEMENIKRRRKHIQSLALALNRLAARGKIGSRPIEGVKNKIYYPKGWEMSDGTVKSEYEYKLQHKVFVIQEEKRRVIEKLGPLALTRSPEE